MKLNKAGLQDRAQWEEKGYKLPQYDHDKMVAATCTNTGLTEGKHCSACAAILLEQRIIPAKGHSQVAIVGETATCTEPGLTDGKKCSECNGVLVAQIVIPALGHVEGNPVVLIEPTETADGVQVIQCVNCKEILRSETITATGTTHVPGDANEDGTVDISDALAILRYCVGEVVIINTRNADVNADDVVDIQDALRILQHNAGWSVILE